jgi:hypothetical protein
MRIVILLVVIAVVFSSLGLWLTAYGNTTSEETNMNYGISMSTDKMIYPAGETILMTLKIFNYTQEEISFQFTTSQRYDFIIEDEEGNEIWRWSQQDMMFAMVLGEETLGPTNIEVIYTAEYKGKLSSGYYKVTGILVAQNRPMSGSIIIEVR